MAEWLHPGHWGCCAVERGGEAAERQGRVLPTHTFKCKITAVFTAMTEKKCTNGSDTETVTDTGVDVMMY